MDSKGTMINRLQRAGLRPAAEGFMTEVRTRLKAARTPRAQAVETAWKDMWERFRPAVEKFEGGNTTRANTVHQGDVDDVIDPDYAETNPRKEMRDSIYWISREFRRVVTDGPKGASVDFHRAKQPPPTTLAILITETYAAKPPDKRDALVSKVLAFAERGLTPEEAETTEYKEGGFLDDID